jgi:hypothetical protein
MNAFRQAFTEASPYRKSAGITAILWTLLIFFLCFLPGNEIPDIRVPFIDKWVHFVLFAAFTLLWCFAFPGRRPARLLLIFAAGCLLGWLVEIIQGQLPASFRRSQDPLDTLADRRPARRSALPAARPDRRPAIVFAEIAGYVLLPDCEVREGSISNKQSAISN